MSSAHTQNLPADLNEKHELADGCEDADTYLSAFLNSSSASSSCRFLFSFCLLLSHHSVKKAKSRDSDNSSPRERLRMETFPEKFLFTRRGKCFIERLRFLARFD